MPDLPIGKTASASHREKKKEITRFNQNANELQLQSNFDETN